MPLAQLASDGTLRFAHLQALDDAFEAPNSVPTASSPRDPHAVLEARLALRDAHVSALCVLEKLPATQRALLQRRLESVDDWHRKACHALGLSPAGSNTPIRFDRTHRAPDQCERAARCIDIGLGVAARLEALAREMEGPNARFAIMALNRYEAEVGRTLMTVNKALNEGVPGLVDELFDLLAHLDQCDLPVLMYNAPGQGTGYLDALGRFRAAVEVKQARFASARVSGQEQRTAEAAPADRNAHRAATWTRPAIADQGPGMKATEWASSDSDNESDAEDGVLRERGHSRA